LKSHAVDDGLATLILSSKLKC